MRRCVGRLLVEMEGRASEVEADIYCCRVVLGGCRVITHKRNVRICQMQCASGVGGGSTPLCTPDDDVYQKL